MVENTTNKSINYSRLLLFLILIILTSNFILQKQKRIATKGNIPQFSHVFLIIDENHSYSQIIGNSSASYINQLASQYGSAANFMAITHPSLPNYIALTSGGTQGIISDCNSCFVSTNNIFNQLEAAGKTWKSYLENMPTNCALSDSPPYALHHNPAAYYIKLRASCNKNDVPYSQFGSDLQSGAIGNLNFIVPNTDNDMHSGTIQAGDAWLKQELPKILASSAYKKNGVVFFTFDEGDKKLSPNQIPTIVISPLAKKQFQSSISYDLYSLLRTIEDGLGLQPLGAAAFAGPMSDFFETDITKN